MRHLGGFVSDSDRIWVADGKLFSVMGGHQTAPPALCFVREQENPHPRPPTPIKGKGEKSRVNARFDASVGRGVKADYFA